MSLFTTWRDAAYYDEDEKTVKELWAKYFEMEKDFYQKVLSDTKTIPTGKIADITEKYGVADIMFMTGIIDGMNDSLKEPLELEDITEEIELKLDLDFEKLYMNMVGAKADWLFNLPEWEPILSEDVRKELYKKQKASTTVVKEKETGRNEPCTCGSGKKYKKCCGK